MCDLSVDVGTECVSRGFELTALDDSIAAASALQVDGLCRVEGRTVTIPEEAFRLMRVVAACFDAGLLTVERRHARAV